MVKKEKNRNINGAEDLSKEERTIAVLVRSNWQVGERNKCCQQEGGKR